MKARKFRFLLFAILLAVAVAVCVPAIRVFFLRIPGRVLVIPESPVKASDVIVLTLDVRRGGALDAADLVQRGIATRVAIFADPPDAAEHEFLHRGVPYRDATMASIGELADLGVRNVERIAPPVSGSENEGDILPGWCERNHFGSVVLVVNTDHSRRLQRILRRSMKGGSTIVTVYPSRYSEFNPDVWWKTREGARTVMSEFPKLLLDFARHPAS